MPRSWISRAAAPTLAALLALAAPARAQQADPARVLAAIPGDVLFLRATGTWSGADRAGTTRIVVLRSGFADETMRLFVQWLAPSPAGGRPAVVATEEVPEVLNWRLRIEDCRVEAEDNGARVTFEATVLTSGRPRSYELVIGPPGEIMFSGR